MILESQKILNQFDEIGAIDSVSFTKGIIQDEIGNKAKGLVHIEMNEENGMKHFKGELAILHPYALAHIKILIKSLLLDPNLPLDATHKVIALKNFLERDFEIDDSQEFEVDPKKDIREMFAFYDKTPHLDSDVNLNLSKEIGVSNTIFKVIEKK